MAGPVTHTLINTVAAPVERVFDTLTDPARMVDWLPACAGVEAKLPVRKGSRLKVKFGDRSTDFEIVDFSAPNTFGWVERGARKGQKTFFRLDFAGAATTITIQDVWVPPSLLARIKARFFPKRNTRQQMDRTLQNLRAVLQGV